MPFAAWSIFEQNSNEWVMIENETNYTGVVSESHTGSIPSDENISASIKQIISNIEAKFITERAVDVLEAADELIILCDSLDKAEEDENEQLGSASTQSSAVGSLDPLNSGNDFLSADTPADQRDYEDIEGRIVMRKRRSAASMRRGFIGESIIIIDGLARLLFLGDCQVD